MTLVVTTSGVEDTAGFLIGGAPFKGGGRDNDEDRVKESADGPA